LRFKSSAVEARVCALITEIDSWCCRGMSWRSRRTHWKIGLLYRT